MRDSPTSTIVVHRVLSLRLIRVGRREEKGPPPLAPFPLPQFLLKDVQTRDRGEKNLLPPPPLCTFGGDTGTNAADGRGDY